MIVIIIFFIAYVYCLIDGSSNYSSIYINYSYWMGSQQAPPMYQYRLVLSQDDKLVNVATDCDFNIEGDIRFPITSNVSSKTKFLVSKDYMYKYHCGPRHYGCCIMKLLLFILCIYAILINIIYTCTILSTYLSYS